MHCFAFSRFILSLIKPLHPPPPGSHGLTAAADDTLLLFINISSAAAALAVIVGRLRAQWSRISVSVRHRVASSHRETMAPVWDGDLDDLGTPTGHSCRGPRADDGYALTRRGCERGARTRSGSSPNRASSLFVLEVSIEWEYSNNDGIGR